MDKINFIKEVTQFTHSLDFPVKLIASLVIIAVAGLLIYLLFWIPTTKPSSKVSASPRLSKFETDSQIKKLEHHSELLSSEISFDYTNNNGEYIIGASDKVFVLRFSKASDKSIHIYNDPRGMKGIGIINDINSVNDSVDLSKIDMSSRNRTINKGGYALLENDHNNFAIIKIIDIKDSSRSDSIDIVTVQYLIC